MIAEAAYNLLTGVTYPNGIPLRFLGANGVIYALNPNNNNRLLYTYNNVDHIYSIDATYATSPTDYDNMFVVLTDLTSGKKIHYMLDALESIEILPAPVTYTIPATIDTITPTTITVVFNRIVTDFPKQVIRLGNAIVVSDPVNTDAGIGLEWQFDILGKVASTNNNISIQLNQLEYLTKDHAWIYRNMFMLDNKPQNTVYTSTNTYNVI